MSSAPFHMEPISPLEEYAYKEIEPLRHCSLIIEESSGLNPKMEISSITQKELKLL